MDEAHSVMPYAVQIAAEGKICNSGDTKATGSSPPPNRIFLTVGSALQFCSQSRSLINYTFMQTYTYNLLNVLLQTFFEIVQFL